MVLGRRNFLSAGNNCDECFTACTNQGGNYNGDHTCDDPVSSAVLVIVFIGELVIAVAWFVVQFACDVMLTFPRIAGLVSFPPSRLILIALFAAYVRQRRMAKGLPVDGGRLCLQVQTKNLQRAGGLNTLCCSASPATASRAGAYAILGWRARKK